MQRGFRNSNQPPPSCLSTLDRFIWDGDQIVTELRLHAPHTTDSTGIELETSSGDFYGQVRYTHAMGIDQPLLVWKDLASPIVPHWSYRGLALSGSYATDGTTPSGITWPAKDRGAFYLPDTRVAPTTQSHWLGSVIDEQADATGLIYKRNRYFNPASGQFAQEDPIGVAGGLNLYGFGDGDPVNFDDPFGLMPCPPMCGGWGSLEQYLRGVGEGARTFAAELGERAEALWREHGDAALNIGLALAQVRGGVRAPGTALLGRNPIAGTGSNPRINTELPGGRAVGKSIFRHFSKGQPVTQSEMGNRGVRRTLPDGTQIRYNPDGSIRLDVPRGPTGRETIHFRP